MIFTIKNNHLSVSIDSYGSHLKSIMAHGREYLWQGDPAVWPNRAPILFPICARMRNNKYTVDGKIYELDPHGFAKYTEFEVAEQTEDSITFTTSYNEKTLAVYPYKFKFSIKFSLDKNKIIKRYIVENLSNGIIYYEAGGHDGFNVPFNDDETMDDCKIRIPGIDSFSPYEQDENVTLLPKARNIEAKDGLIDLKPSIHGLNCIIVEGLPIPRAEFVDKNKNVKLAVEFPMMPYLTLWSMPKDFDVNFVCIEPWTSLPDANFVSSELKDKVGVRLLEAGQSETTGYDIIIY